MMGLPKDTDKLLERAVSALEKLADAAVRIADAVAEEEQAEIIALVPAPGYDDDECAAANRPRRRR